MAITGSIVTQHRLRRMGVRKANVVDLPTEFFARQNRKSSIMSAEKYLDSMLSISSDRIQNLVAKHRDALIEVSNNHIFQFPGPQTLNLPRSEAEVRFFDLFHSYGEISTSLDLLKSMADLPIRGAGFTPAHNVRANIESYLSETYVLYERLKTHLDLIERAARGNRETYSRVLGLFPALKKSIELKLSPRTRGFHVHQARYNDADLSRLTTIELLMNHSEPDEIRKIFRGYYKSECRLVRKRWRKIISDKNTDPTGLTDLYFGALYPLVFDPKIGILSELVTPKVTAQLSNEQSLPGPTDEQ
jgi:hypothetical protein